MGTCVLNLILELFFVYGNGLVSRNFHCILFRHAGWGCRRSWILAISLVGVMDILISIHAVDRHATVTALELQPVNMFIFFALRKLDAILIIDRVDLVRGGHPDSLAPQNLHLGLYVAVISFGRGAGSALRLLAFLIGICLFQLFNDTLIGV